MNLQQFKYVLEAYRLNSISKAAAALFVTQPTLSIAIKELESELGFAIFERTSKGILPTPAGTAFVDSIRDVLFDLERIKEQYTSSDSMGAMTILHISTCRYTFTSTVVLQFYAEEVRDLNRYSITVVEQDTRQCVQDVLGRKSDIGIIHINSRGNAAQLAYFAEKKLDCTKLFESRPYLLFRKGHPLETMAHISDADIARYPQIRGTSHTMDLYQSAASFSFLHYSNNDKNILLTSRSLIYSLLEQSDAVFLGVSSKGVLELHPRLAARQIENGDMNYFYAITLHGTPLSKPARNFLKILVEKTADGTVSH